MEPTMKSRQSSAARTAATVAGGSSGATYAVRDVRVCARWARSSASGDRVAGGPVGGAVVDAAHGVERRHVPAAEPEADVGAREELGPDDEAGPQRRAEGGVDALELVADRDDGGVVDRHLGVGPADGGLERVVQGLALAVGPGLDDVTDERHR